MLRHLAVLSALALGSVSIAHADDISGFFSATGNDVFTSSTITFEPGTSVVSGAIGGTFALFLADGDAINFPTGPLPYVNGGTTTAPPGTVLFTTSGGGATFTFNLADYTATFINNGTMGCPVGGTCLIASGDGTISATGAITGTSGAAVFDFTSQYVPGQPLDSITTFSASTAAVAAPVPEPATLALVGSGLLSLAGLAGFARRKFSF